jgi:hypothetical protein
LVRAHPEHRNENVADLKLSVIWALDVQTRQFEFNPSGRVVRVYLGESIPLIQPRHRSIPLKLLSAKPYADGVVRLHYAVLCQTRGTPT